MKHFTFPSMSSHKLQSLAAAAAICLATQGCSAAEPLKSDKPAKVQITHTDGRYQLLVDGKPFYIKGAGIEFGNPEKLAEHGGNSFRTWRVENGRDSCETVLDRAFSNGLYVTMGIDVARERHGFDYNDDAAVTRQLEEIKQDVLKYKDHPALIIWCIGNELNLNARNPKVWNAVNDISKMIHAVDTNHLTMTALAGIGKDVIRQIKARAPDLDLIGIQMYADIENLPSRLRDSQWEGPYIVTEWGATGHWEVDKTAWGAPIENDSTIKANFYRKRYETVIKPDTTQCLGSYVFLWEQKQERTPTWYGMFLDTGEETATVDTMHTIWNGKPPANCSPKVDGTWLDGKTAHDSVHLKAGQTYTAKTLMEDPDHDPLTYLWEVMHESTSTKTGGDFENKPPTVSDLIANPNKSEISLTAPTKPGAYRLFVYARDGHGHAAHANIPFYVDGGPETAQATTPAAQAANP